MHKSGTAMALLFAIGACSSGSDSVDVNLPPIVNAGGDIVAAEAANVQLDATVIDVDSSTTLQWSQISGPLINLSAGNIEDPTFRAPIVPDDREIVLRLTASDEDNTVSDDIRITVSDTDPDNGPSPQGIDDNGRDRRDGARNGRNNNRPMQDGREVRTFDGTNNNVANPLWGASFEHLQRLGSADYDDGISSLAGVLRPSARVVSNDIVNQDDGEVLPNTFEGTDFVWQWGQFMDHDIDLTDGAEESADIEVPTGDPSFDPDSVGGQVISFSRALFDPDSGTDASNPREQENEITSWIDGSMVYGSSDERALALRIAADSPFLATSNGNLLPFNADSLTNANGFVTDPTTLFLAGDIRANEQVGLATMHTLFVREHNRIAQILQNDNPGASGEDIYQAARRLVIAKIQIITYDEWLPALLGQNAVPPYAGYDDSVNPTIFNEFSAAAFRLGHSMINDQLLRLDANGNEIADGNLELADAFFTAQTVLSSEDSLDPILRGLATQSHQVIDNKIANDLRNFLFGLPGQGGLDLASLNIQRGRDHGLPSYNDMRVAMGLQAVSTFTEITSDTAVSDALSATYPSVDEIDLWVGGLAEEPFGNSQLGELFHTIILKQFLDLRAGDRFWYENDLTQNERDRVRNTSLSRIIQDNTGVGSEIQTNVFQTSN